MGKKFLHRKGDFHTFAAMEKIPFELSSLSQAVRYQEWMYRAVEPFLGSRILELGAGIGNMSRWLPLREQLILTEVAPDLLALLKNAFSSRQENDSRLVVRSFDVLHDQLEPQLSEKLDTVISFNVLEHIEDDHQVLGKLSSILRSSQATGPKRLISVVPSHAWAYGSMDRNFGHYRRYSRKSFLEMARDVAPDAKVQTRHFNLFGLVGWLLNGRILRKENIGEGSIRAFESLCPVLRPIDDFIHQSISLPLGQSLIVVMEW